MFTKDFDKHFISFIEEFSMNPKYQGWSFGRIEVHYPPSHPEANKWGYTDEEIRWCVCPSSRDKFFEFRERWDFIDITEYHLNWLRDFMKRKYQEYEE